MAPTLSRRASIDGIDLSPPAPGRLLPPRAFVSPAVYEAEMRRIFDRGWVHVADLPELRVPGDFVASTIGTTPVVVVRTHDGAIRGFVNACRHRGATIAEGRGNCGRQLRCPYHAWSYGTDGRLIGVGLCCRPLGLGAAPLGLGRGGASTPGSIRFTSAATSAALPSIVRKQLNKDSNKRMN